MASWAGPSRHGLRKSAAAAIFYDAKTFANCKVPATIRCGVLDAICSSYVILSQTIDSSLHICVKLYDPQHEG